MAQTNKTCQVCGEKGHSKFYCKNRATKPIARTPLKKTTTKAPVKKKKRTESRGQLVRRLDAIFSQYIRLKDAVNGEARCVTCGSVKPWKEMQNGHYESRGKLPTRWDEENCHVQDYACNVAMKGNYTSYARYMITRYGADKLEELHLKATSGIKITTPEIRDLIEEYKMKVKELL